MFVCVCVCMCWGVFNVTKFTCFTQGPCVAWGAHTDEVVHALHTLGSVEAWITLALVNVCQQHTYTHTHTHTHTHIHTTHTHTDTPVFTHTLTHTHHTHTTHTQRYTCTHTHTHTQSSSTVKVDCSHTLTPCSVLTI